MNELEPGWVVWIDGDPVRGREQGGRRPYVILSSREHLDLVDTLLIAAPVTTSRREWANHVRAQGNTGLIRESWIMTEQIRVLSRDRIFGYLGEVSADCLAQVRMWVGEFLGLAR